MATPFKSSLNNSERTWGQSNSGGLNITIGTGSPIGTSSGTLGGSNVITNNFPDFANIGISFPLFIEALSDNTQRYYDEGDLLFTYRPRRGLDTNSYAVLTLWNLNYMLEMASIVKILSPNSPIRAGGHLDRFLDFPTTVEEFCENILFYGVFGSFNDKKVSRKRKIGSVIKYRTKIPNLWLKDESGNSVGIGDTVGLVVKFVTSQHTGRMNVEGQLEADASSHKFLQVRPYFEKDCHKPIHNSNPWKRDSSGKLDPYRYGEPGDADLDYVADVEVAPRRFAWSNATKLFDLSAPPTAVPNVKPLKAPVYGQGFYIRLGRVIMRDKEPHPNHVFDALRSHTGYKTLLRYSSLVIDFEPFLCTDIL
jgi:hypothetical protein